MLLASCGNDSGRADDGDSGRPAPGGDGDDLGGKELPPPLEGSLASSPSCAGVTNAAPVAPSIVAPMSGALVAPAELVVRASPFADPDGDGHGASEIEIRRERDATLVWRAVLYGSFTEARLADGGFSEAAAGGLDPWTRYRVQARYRDDAECSAIGEFGAPLSFRTEDGSAYLFDEAHVRRFDLEIPPASWQAIDAEAVPPSCDAYERSYHTGTLRFEGQTFAGVGLRVKGSCGSGRRLSEKAAFKVSLSWDDPAVPGCPVERRLYGEKHFTFNNGAQDWSLAHELLGYRFFRALGLPSPRAAHARLYVNGEYWGLYVHLESIDRRYLARRFASARGMMYEGANFCDLVPASLPPGEEETTCLRRKFEPSPCDSPEPGDDPLDYSLARDLVGRIEALPEGGFYPAVESFFDFETFLTQWAADTVISHWDSYENWIENNWRVYHEPTSGRWTIIQTGIDQTFKTDRDGWNVGAVLARRCLDELACEAAFAAHLHAAVDLFEALDLTSEADAIYQRILTDVDEDPRKEFDMATFAAKYQDLDAWIRARPGVVRTALRARGF